mgnify:CR=1 FL=1
MAIYISDRIMQKYDLSCPKCGGLNNIRIAGVYENKRTPEHWLCHCGTCNKCYRPRKREDESSMASTMETARQKLPKDVLGALLAEGRTQQSIADEYSIPFWAVYELKKQYWPDGFNPDEFKQQQAADNAARFEAYPGKEDAQEATEEELPEPEPEEEQVEASKPPAAADELSEVLAWAKPVRLGTGGVTLKIYEDRISISSAAVKLLRPAEFVRIGVLKNGALVLAPAGNITEGFRLAQNHSHIGGGALVKFLKKHGFGVGEYELEKNEKGWLVTRR